MKQKTGILFLILSMVFMTYSCGSRSDNRKLVEAASIHDKMMAKHDSIYGMLEEQEKRVASKLSRLSAKDPDRVAYESMNRSINRSYNLLDSWKEGLAEVPNYSQNSENGDNKNNKGMSDQKILDLQKAYSTRLDEVSRKINELITTMDMYTKDKN